MPKNKPLIINSLNREIIKTCSILIQLLYGFDTTFHVTYSRKCIEQQFATNLIRKITWSNQLQHVVLRGLHRTFTLFCAIVQNRVNVQKKFLQARFLAKLKE
jgi:hypothetical protein